MVFADYFPRCFQANGVFVICNANGILFCGCSGNGSYFQTDAFPMQAVSSFSVAGPGQGMSDFMQDCIMDFMWLILIGMDKVEGEGNDFFPQAAHAQSAFGPVPSKGPFLQSVFIQLHAGIGFHVMEPCVYLGISLFTGHVME